MLLLGMKPPLSVWQRLMPYEQRAEWVLVAGVLFSAAWGYMGMVGAQAALIISMLSLALLYFLSTSLPHQTTSVLGNVARKVVGLSSAVVVVGLLFTVLHLSGAQQMLLVGVGSLALSGSLLLYVWLTTQGNYFPLLIRVVVLGGIGVSTLMALLKQVPA